MSETLVELVAKISADATELKKGLGDAEKGTASSAGKIEKQTASIGEQFRGVGRLAAGMGASITAAMTIAIMSFTKVGSELSDLSAKTGVSVKTLAGLQYAAEQSGGTMGTVEMAIRRVSSAMEDAKDGLAESVRSFDKLGISLADLKGLNPEEQFLKIAEAIAEVPDPMRRAAIAQDMFGRSGMDLLPMLAGGAAGLKNMMAEGQKLTGWTTEGAASADAFGDAIGTMQTALKGLWNIIGAALAPTLQQLVGNITGMIGTFRDWSKEHPELVKQVSALVLAVGGFLTIAGALMLMAPAIGAAWTVAMGPVGIITAAIAGLIAATMLLWKNWDAITDFFGDKTAKEAKRARESAEQELAALTKKVEEEAKNQIRIKLNALYEEKEAVKAHYTTTVALLKAAYGEEAKIEKSKIELARETRDARLQYLDAVIAQTEAAHNAELSAINERYGVDTSNQRSIREQTTENYNIRVQQLDDELAKADKNYNAQIVKLREVFGVSDAGNRSRMAMATEAANAAKQGLDDELKKAREVHSEKMAMLSEEYSKALKAIAVRSDKNIADIQKQIDAIDAQTKADEAARRRQAQVDKIADITYRLSKAKTAEEIANLEEDLGKAYAEMEAQKVEVNRQSQKQILQDIISGIRQARSEEEAMAAFDLQVAQAVEKSKLQTTIDSTTSKKEAIDISLKETLADIETERKAAEAMETDKFKKAKENIGNRRKEIKTAYNDTLNEIETERGKAVAAENEKYEVTKRNLAWEKIEITKWHKIELGQIESERDAYIKAEADKQKALQATITLQEKALQSVSGTVPAAKRNALIGPAQGPSGAQPGIYLNPKMPGMASGGIVTGPTVAMVGEAGPEAVIPLNQGLGGVTVNFSQPVFFDREDTMNKFVDMIRKGIQRSDRLRFGGAYNG